MSSFMKEYDVSQASSGLSTKNQFAVLAEDYPKSKKEEKKGEKKVETTIEEEFEEPPKGFELSKGTKKKMSRKGKKSAKGEKPKTEDITKEVLSDTRSQSQKEEDRQRKIQTTLVLLSLLLTAFKKLFASFGEKVEKFLEKNNNYVPVYQSIRSHSIKDDDEKSVKTWASILYTTARKISEVGFGIDPELSRKIEFDDTFKRQTVNELVGIIERAADSNSPLRKGDSVPVGLEYDLLVNFSQNNGKITREPSKATIQIHDIFALCCAMVIGRDTKNLGKVGFSMIRFLKNLGKLNEEIICKIGVKLSEKPQQVVPSNEDFQNLTDKEVKPKDKRWVRSNHVKNTEDDEDSDFDDDAFSDCVVEDLQNPIKTETAKSDIPVAKQTQKKTQKQAQKPISRPLPSNDASSPKPSPKPMKKVVFQETQTVENVQPTDEFVFKDEFELWKDRISTFRDDVLDEIDMLKDQNRELKEENSKLGSEINFLKTILTQLLSSHSSSKGIG